MQRNNLTSWKLINCHFRKYLSYKFIAVQDNKCNYKIRVKYVDTTHEEANSKAMLYYTQGGSWLVFSYFSNISLYSLLVLSVWGKTREARCPRWHVRLNFCSSRPCKVKCSISRTGTRWVIMLPISLLFKVKKKKGKSWLKNYIFTTN